MWKHPTAEKLREFASIHGDEVKIQQLDEKLDQITFTSLELPSSPAKHLQKAIEENSLVLSMIPNAFEDMDINTWCKLLEDITRWPFYYKLSEDSLQITFCNVSAKKGENFNFEEILSTLQTYELPKVNSVEDCRWTRAQKKGTASSRKRRGA
jgi:hypothetical protein